ncbi:MAG: hypothetical protein AAGE80_05300 [Pseudomonadota bacterium]
MSDTRLPSKILLVLGMHRSGSSALTRSLSLLGYGLPKTLIKDNTSNRRGHWESQPLARLNDNYLKQADLVWSDWVSGHLARMRVADRDAFQEDLLSLIGDEFAAGQPAVIKDPRICRLIPSYRAAFSERVPMQAVVVIRNPLEVIASLVRRNNMTESNAGLLWLRYMLDAVVDSDGLPRAFIAYDQLVDDPATALKGIEKALDASFPAPIDHVLPEIEGLLSKGLQNHDHSSEEVIHHDLTHGWISDTYAALRLLTRDATASEPLESIARVKKQTRMAEPMLGYIVKAYDDQLRELRRRASSLSASVDLKTEQVRLLRDALNERDEKIERMRQKKLDAPVKLARKGLRRLFSSQKAT